MGGIAQFALNQLTPDQIAALQQQTQPDQTQPQQQIQQPQTTTGRESDFSSAGAMDLGPRQPQQPPAPGTADLENLRSQDVDMTAHVLRGAQQQNLALQDQLHQTRQQVADPLNRIAATLADQYQQLQQQRSTGIKGMLRNFLGGMGASMMHDAGLPSPEQKQGSILQQLVQVKNAQTIETLRQAQAQQLQLVSRTMPDGTPIQLTQAEAGKFDTSMARGTLANQKPDLNDLIGRTVYSALQQGRDPNQDPVVQQLLQVQRATQKPPADTAAAQKEQFMQGLQPAIAANEITPGMMTDVRKLVTGIQNSKAIPQQTKPGLVSYLLANTTPASTGTQAAVKISLEDQNKPVAVLDTKQGNSLTYLPPADINARDSVEPGRYIQPGQSAQTGKTGYAYDPAANQTLLTSAGEAQQKGYQAFRPVTEANIRNDTHDAKILNDVAAKSNNLIAASKVMDDPDQRALITRVIDGADKDDQYRLGAFGLNFPSGWFNNLINQENASALKQPARDYLVAVLSLREASMGMQRLLTGTARANESQIKALQATLPGGGESDSRLVLQKMAAFTQNLDMLRQGIPKLPGIDVIPINRSAMQYQQPAQQYNSSPAAGTVAPSAMQVPMQWNPL